MTRDPHAAAHPRQLANLPRHLVNLIVCLILLVSVLVIYWQVGNHEFINFDDNKYIVNNPHVNQGLSWGGLRWALTRSHASNWHPLTWLSHMLDCQLFGLAPGRHHLVNVGLHAVNAMLLFVTLQFMTGAFWPSVLVAALFAIHPLRVESVAWASERKDVLAGLFWILTLLAYAWYARHPRLLKYLLVAILFALGLTAKPMLVTLPFVLLLLDVWPLCRWKMGDLPRSSPPEQPYVQDSPVKQWPFKQWPSSRLLLEKVPLFCLSAASSVVTVMSQAAGGAMGALETVPLSVRVANAVVAYGTYLWKSFWPTGLAIFYPHPATVQSHPLPGLIAPAIGASVVLAAITIVVVMQLHRRPYLAVGWFWYVGTLVPVIGLVKVGSQSMADRYTYLTIVGVYIALAWGLRDLLAPRGQVGRIVAGFVISLLLLALLVTALRQAGHWQNSHTLFEHTLHVTTDNYMAHNSLGSALLKQEDVDQAEKHFERAIQICPTFADAHFYLGVIQSNRGDSNLAMQRFRHAIKFDPWHAEAHYNLAVLLGKMGKQTEAFTQYENALKINRDHVNALYNLGCALSNRGDLRVAVALFNRALKLSPDDARIHTNLGIALARQKESANAVLHLEHALRLNPKLAHAHYNLAVVFLGDGNPVKAIHHLREALQIDPELVQAHFLLGTVLERQGNWNDALSLYRKAVQEKPDSVADLNRIAWILATCDDPLIRDGQQAVRLALQITAQTKSNAPNLLNTLAATYAESRQWTEAVATAKRALELASTGGNTTLARQIEVGLRLYQRQKPLRIRSGASSP